MPNPPSLLGSCTAGALLLISTVAPTQSPAQQPPAEKPDVPVIVPEKSFAVPDGMEVTIWATTPMLRNPTNMDFDKDGRLWIAEGVNYRSKGGRQKDGDRIVILEDADGDGKADNSSVFVQEPALRSPLGVAVLDNKIVVSQPPDMLVYTDVNRDGVYDPKVDKREVLLTGFNGQQHDHSLHSIVAGPDGQWYWNMGNCGAMFTDRSGKTFRMGSPYAINNVVDTLAIAGQKSDDGNVWIGGFSARMNPDGTAVNIIGHNYRNSYEQIISSYGDLFQSDNDDPPACRVTAVLEYGNAGFASADGKRSWSADKRPGQSTATAEWRQEDPGVMPAGDIYGGGSPAGVGFYEHGALGDAWNGLLLTCEAGRNVVFGYLPKPDGAGFKLERFDFMTSNKEQQFAGSDFLGGGNSVNYELKTLFRPSDVTVGPDGAIYVADWFDARVGGHATLDDTVSGTIYRIAPKGFKSIVPKLNLDTTEGQILALQSAAVNVRNSGFTRLKAQGKSAVPAVAKLLENRNPFIRARAIWLLAQMGPSGIAVVEPLLDSTLENTRLVAYRALRRAQHAVLPMAKKMAQDPSAAVRREVALTMRDVPLESSRDILVSLAKQFDGKDRTYLEALGTGATGKEASLYTAISKAMGGPALQWSEAFAWIAWRLHPEAAVADLKLRAQSDKITPPQRKLMMDALAFVKAPNAASAMVDLAADQSFPFASQALWWLFNRKGNDWASYQLDGAMKTRGLYDPDAIKLTSFMTPPPPTGPSTLKPTSEILKLKGNVEAGRLAAASCYACHVIGAQGVDLGPDLTIFGKTQTREVILDAIVNPSADIAHGFEGGRLETHDGLIIEGIIVANGDPVIIKSMGGLTQTVPRSRIKSQSKLNRSLMLSAQMLGLDEQKLADIIAYLQSSELK